MEEEGERRSAEEEAMVGRVVHTAGGWIKQKRRRTIRTEMDLVKAKRKCIKRNESAVGLTIT